MLCVGFTQLVEQKRPLLATISFNFRKTKRNSIARPKWKSEVNYLTYFIFPLQEACNGVLKKENTVKEQIVQISYIVLIEMA